MDRIKNIEKIIEEPVHGRKFYTYNNLVTLKRKIIKIYNFLNIDEDDEEKIVKSILEYIKSNVLYKKSYFDCFNRKTEKFDYANVKYRTAYGALVEGEAICTGYAEAIRILLSLYNIKSYTFLCKLPLERKKLLHYIVVVKSKKCHSKYIVLDPESEQYCKKNEINYEEYRENCIYTIADEIFTKDVIGKDGAGMLAEEYLKNEKIPRVIGSRQIYKLVDCLEKNDNKEKQEIIA